jgi:hypothetical protein
MFLIFIVKALSLSLSLFPWADGAASGILPQKPFEVFEANRFVSLGFPISGQRAGPLYGQSWSSLFSVVSFSSFLAACALTPFYSILFLSSSSDAPTPWKQPIALMDNCERQEEQVGNERRWERTNSLFARFFFSIFSLFFGSSSILVSF